MNIVDRFERNLTDLIARFVPWLSPLPTAYLTARASMVHLQWPESLAIVAGIVIECLGMSAMNTVLELYNYNRSRAKSHPPAPLWIALAIAAVYFVAVTGLMVVLDTIAGLSRLAPLMFPLLSISGVTLIALRMDHRRRLEVIAADRAERSLQRRAGRSGAGQATGQLTGQENRELTGETGQDASLTAANAARRQNRDDAIRAALTYVAGNPDASFSQIGKAADRSKTWAISTMADLEAAGQVHRNGRGWEVRGAGSGSTSAGE